MDTVTNKQLLAHNSKIIANQIVKDSQAPLEIVDQITNALQCFIINLEAKIDIGSDIDYFDYSLVAEAVKHDVEQRSLLDSELVDELVVLTERAIDGQVERFLADIAHHNNINNKYDVARLQFIHLRALKIEAIRNHSDYLYLTDILIGIDNKKRLISG
ncbi:hypothetical protein N9Y67_04145 [Pseudomonadota bacterium]|nr:hypothetical protein [Pseudomonadota bacterium]